MATIKSGTLTYTDPLSLKHTITLSHVVEVIYDEPNKQVILNMTNGSVTVLNSTTENLYETIIASIQNLDYNRRAA